MMTGSKNTNPPHPWSWFTEKVLPSIFIALALAVGGAAWWTHQTVNQLIYMLENQQKDITRLEMRIQQVESSAMTRSEVLENVKRIEQYIEIIMLRAGMNVRNKGLP